MKFAGRLLCFAQVVGVDARSWRGPWSGATMTNYPGQAPAKMTPEFQVSHLHAALQKQSWFGFTLTLEQEPSACRLAAAEQRQFASISRTGSHWHHRPCDSSISVPLLRLQACSARRRAWGVWWAGRQVRACVDGGRTWLPEPKATATRRTTGVACGKKA